MHGVAAPRPMTLRTFTLRYGSAYRPLVGGLANVLESTDRGGVPVSSKDVWVLKESASDPDQRLTDVLPMTSARSVNVLVPRVLEDMFWVGRYAERAEDHAAPGAGRARLRRGLPGAAALDGRHDPRRPDGDDPRTGRARPGAAPGPVRRRLPVAAARPRPGGLGGALARGAARRDAGRARPAVGRHVARLRHRRPGRPGAARAAAQPPGRRVGRPDAHRDPGPAGRDGEHDARPGLAHDRRGPLPRAVAPGVPPARRDHHGAPRASTSTARCSTRCSPPPRARSPTGAATAATSARPASSSCCCSTRTTRGRWSSASASCATHLAAQPASTGSTRPERLLADLDAELGRTDLAALVAIGGVGRPNLEAYLAATAATLTRLAEAAHEQHFATGPAPRPMATMELVEVRASAA